jgi:hypothetical protein
LVGLWTAVIGVVGTLLGVLITQHFAARAADRRQLQEDGKRWLSERLQVSRTLLARSSTIERDLWSACSHLDREARAVRMPGYTTILLTPVEGLPGVFDEISRAIIVEAVEDAFDALNQVEELEAEVQLIGSPTEGHAAVALVEALWEVVGFLEGYGPFDDAADAVLRAKAAREAFRVAARESLMVDPAATPPDVAGKKLTSDSR